MSPPIPSPAFDPPEYLKGPSAEATQAFAAQVAQGPWAAALDAAPPELYLTLYRGLVATRLHDRTLARWARTGAIPKAWLGTGEEACTVGPVAAMARGADVLGPMIRNAGAGVMWDVGLAHLFRAYLGRAGGPTRGRDLHIGDLDRGVMTPISHVGSLASVMAGMALAFKSRGEARVALTWVGDGAAHTGEVHEALAMAAATAAPLITIIQDNGVALGTPRARHHRGSFTALGAFYGIPCRTFDGNHVLEAWAATRWARDICLAGEGPALLCTQTFRMGGHATHDEAEGRRILPAAAFAHWGARDPLALFADWLLSADVTLPGGEAGAARASLLRGLEAEVLAEMEAAAAEALASPIPPASEALGGVYADDLGLDPQG